MTCLRTGHLVLEPLTPAHAERMHAVLAQPALYRYLDYGPPPSIEHVRKVYGQLEKGFSPDGREAWFNWIVCLDGREAIGFVQATVEPHGRAWIAYLLSQAHWGHGHALAAMHVMLDHLHGEHGITEFLACVERDNRRSIVLLERLGFRRAPEEAAALHELSATELLFHAGTGRHGAA